MKELILTEERYQRSIVSMGHRGRLQGALRSKEGPLVYAAIGGSITQGAAAAPREDAYVHLFAQWLDGVVEGGCECVNAGIGASNSHFGAFRVGKDVLDAQPDIVTIEYAVNDVDNPLMELSYESLIRQCLQHESQPAVILIFTMRDDGTNCQAVQAEIGAYFDLPMLSYRDALYPDVEAGEIDWEDLSPDEVHPNNQGHRFMADLLARFVLEAQKAEVLDPLRDVSPPRIPESTKFDQGVICDATEIQILSNQGWQKGPHKGGYTGFQSEQPGSEILVAFTARYAAIGYKKYAGDFGRVALVLDDGAPQILEGFYERPPIQAWAGGHTVLETLVDGSEARHHTLRITLLDEIHADSTGHCFDIGYLLLST